MTAPTSEFRPGLEGVVAFETEIAEPDKDGGSLRYRGIDIEDLVGRYPFEKVWGLLVDEDINSPLPFPEPIELQDPSGAVPSDLQAGLASLGPKWGLQKLVDIDASQARDDLARLSAATLSIVAQAARGKQTPVPDSEVKKGENAAAQFLIRWRGEADPKHIKAIDTYWITAAEHGLNASTFTARIATSTGADCAAVMSSAVGTLSGPLHGGAPARVLPMIDGAAEHGDPEAYVRAMLDRGERIMGFGHRVYRAYDPRAAGRRARGVGPLGGLPRARGRLSRRRAVPVPREDGAAAARPRRRQPGGAWLCAAGARAALARPSQRHQRRAAAAQ